VDRVKTIHLEIPRNEVLVGLLQEVSNLSFDKVLSTNLPELSPQSVISHTNVDSPQLSFATDDGEYMNSWVVGNLRFGFNLDGSQKAVESKNVTELNLGKERVSFVSIERLSEALTGNLNELNHFGINFGPQLINKNDYLKFRTELAKRSNLYSYPTGEEWPFLIPATEQEFKDGIRDESVQRNPKFELVFSDYHPEPLIQFDVETRLSRKKLEELFPKPFGIAFEGLEEMFRAVFVKTEWNGVILRFDLGFRKEKKDFGYWIIKNGKRY
jgi:hypothetical protein